MLLDQRKRSLRGVAGFEDLTAAETDRVHICLSGAKSKGRNQCHWLNENRGENLRRKEGCTFRQEKNKCVGSFAWAGC